MTDNLRFGREVVMPKEEKLAVETVLRVDELFTHPASNLFNSTISEPSESTTSKFFSSEVKRRFIKPLGDLNMGKVIESCDERFDCFFSSEFCEAGDALCGHRLSTPEEKMTRLFRAQRPPSRKADREEHNIE